MADNEEPEATGTEPALEEPRPIAAEAPPGTPVATPLSVPVAAPARQSLRDRVFSFRAVVAVGLATLLLGGAGGAALVAATGDDHDGRHHRMGRFEHGPGRDGFGPGGGYGRRGGGPGFGPGGPGGGPGIPPYGAGRGGAQVNPEGGTQQAPPQAPQQTPRPPAGSGG